MHRLSAFIRGLPTTVRQDTAEFLRASADGIRQLSPSGLARQAAVVAAGVAGEAALLVARGGDVDVAVSLGVAAVLLVRLFLPGVALCAAVLLLAQPGHPAAVAVVMCAWSVGLCPRGPWRTAAVLSACGLVWVFLPVDPSFAALDTPAGYGAALALPVLAGRHLTQRRQLASASARVEQQLRRERALMVRQAQLSERGRIARDMHDGLGHRLSLLSVLSGALQVEPGLTASAAVTVRNLHATALGAVTDLAALVGALATSEHSGTHTLDALPGLIEGSRITGARVGFRRSGAPRELPVAVSRTAYRVVQEALTNAHKHATGAPIAVSVSYEPDALLVEVRNDAPAHPPPGSAGTRLGLIGLDERVRLAGGILRAEPVADGGFRVAAILPYDAERR